ncbi:MAG: hypothetical protein SXA11_22350 [Cyanobacteriota bacterium]|nr:hypothetical protein [Cyanobacteriota bacterium]
MTLPSAIATMMSIRLESRSWRVFLMDLLLMLTIIVEWKWCRVGGRGSPEKDVVNNPAGD